MTSLPISGVIEGFYGPTWSWDDRLRMIDRLAEHGANTYVYAPKNDPLHRDRWREPYLPEEWDRFAEVARHAEARGVDLWFGISPLGMRVTDGDDVASLLAKLEAADASGLRRFCLLVDDMPDAFASSTDAERFATLAAAHIHLVELVRARLMALGADRRLWFVPLHYHGDPDRPYVRDIGRGIHPDVAIMWTGPEVCSETLTLEHTAAVAASLRRPVLYWDNHPVNDGPMRNDPHLGPLRGRDARLGEAASGILSNVAIEPETSAIAVLTFLRYAADPGSYDPDAAWADALLEVAGNDRDARAVAVLADLARRSPLQRGDPLTNALATPLERCRTGWERAATRRSSLAEVGAVFDELIETAEHLAAGLTNARLRTDLAPWSEKLVHQTRAAREAIAVLLRALDDPHDRHLDDRRRAVIDRLSAARRTSPWVAGDQLDVFARWCLARADGLAGPDGASS